MKKLAAFLAALTGLTAALAIGAHAAEPVDVVNIPEKAVTVDGVIADGEWDGATRMVLNISDTSTWSEFGAGIVGTDGWSQLNHTDDDFTTELAFTVDGEDLYILLTRKDSTLNFASDNYHRPYSSDCALMWFYDTEYGTQYGLQLLAANKSGTPIIGYFFMDSDQGSSDNLMELEYAEAVTKTTADSYIMEAKVNMKGMDDFGHDMLAGGNVNVTWCAVNICEEGWDSDDDQHVLWGTYNYQAQYKGVNDWENAPKAKLVSADEVPYAPVGEVSVPYATPVIDGVISEGEYPESGKVILNKAQGNLTALGWVGEVPAENSIELYYAWDKNSFYLAGNVTDPAFNYSDIGQYNGDAFQVSLNIANVFKTDDGYDRAIFYSWGLQEEGTIDVIRQESANNDTIFEVGRGQKTEIGWTFEVALSLEMLAEDAYLKGGEEAIPEPGMPIGGLFCYLDHDDTGALINAFGTSTDEVMGWDPDAHGITFLFDAKEGGDEPADPNAPAILWDFNADGAMDANMGANSGANTLSWTADKDDAGNEYYTFTASGADPYVSVDLSAPDVSDVVWAKARVKNAGPATAIELFGHTNDRGLTGSECTHINVGTDDEWHTYIIYIPDENVTTVNAYKDPQYAITEPYWEGTVDWIRLDPMWQEGDDGNDAGGSMNDGDQIMIDYIAFFSSEEAAKAFRSELDSAYVAPEEPPVVEPVAEEPAAEEPAEEPSVDQTLDQKAEAPNTFDFGILAAVASVVSLGGFALTKKRH